ncbi:MAG: chemotaxis protein CheD [Pirellulales bacterium]
MPSTVLQPPTEAQVGMGQIALVSGEQVARSVLGSCIGVAVYDSRNGLVRSAHVVLPSCGGRAGTPGKFADTAVPWMLDALRKAGADVKRLTAKITGGANMFAADGPFQIGKQNADAVRAQLSQAGIRLVAENLGGAHGRKITFSPRSGALEIEAVGQAKITI